MSSTRDSANSGADGTAFGQALTLGGLTVRLAGPKDMPALGRLRARAFRGDDQAYDLDEQDSRAWHLWLGQSTQADCPGAAAEPLATARLTLHTARASLLAGYCAQSYDLCALSALPGPVLEVGRVCLDPRIEADTAQRADLFRLMWAGIARLVLRHQVQRLIGCASFATTDPRSCLPALQVLAARHIGPARLRPAKRAAETFDLPAPGADITMEGLQALPPLLRAYLAWGGWVSDHLVIDRDLATAHVFTCVEVATMPDARKRVLARMADGGGAGPLGQAAIAGTGRG